MAQPINARGRKRADIINDYDAFVDKFKPRHTTDSCNTPDHIYNAILQYLIDGGHITPDTPIVRPFWPGADYTDPKQYTPGSVVVDNPPFSILAQILRHYNATGIPYFLFAPSLTSFNYTKADFHTTIIITDKAITYENGAKVNTAFLTNLPAFRPYVALTAPDLAQRIKQAKEQYKAQHPNPLPVYQYPANLVTATILHRIAHTKTFKIPRAQAHRVTRLEAQRPHKKNIFGTGLLIPDTLAAQLQTAQLQTVQLQTAQLQAAQLQAARATLVFPLSEAEKAIIKDLEK